MGSFQATRWILTLVGRMFQTPLGAGLKSRWQFWIWIVAVTALTYMGVKTFGVDSLDTLRLLLDPSVVTYQIDQNGFVHDLHLPAGSNSGTMSP